MSTSCIARRGRALLPILLAAASCVAVPRVTSAPVEAGLLAPGSTILLSRDGALEALTPEWSLRVEAEDVRLRAPGREVVLEGYGRGGRVAYQLRHATPRELVLVCEGRPRIVWHEDRLAVGDRDWLLGAAGEYRLDAAGELRRR